MIAYVYFVKEEKEKSDHDITPITPHCETEPKKCERPNNNTPEPNGEKKERKGGKKKRKQHQNHQTIIQSINHQSPQTHP